MNRDKQRKQEECKQVSGGSSAATDGDARSASGEGGYGAKHQARRQHAQREIHRPFHFGVAGEKPTNRYVTDRGHCEPNNEAGNDRKDESEPIGHDRIALRAVLPNV